MPVKLDILIPTFAALAVAQSACATMREPTNENKVVIRVTGVPKILTVGDHVRMSFTPNSFADIIQFNGVRTKTAQLLPDTPIILVRAGRPEKDCVTLPVMGQAAFGILVPHAPDMKFPDYRLLIGRLSHEIFKLAPVQANCWDLNSDQIRASSPRKSRASPPQPF